MPRTKKIRAKRIRTIKGGLGFGLLLLAAAVAWSALPASADWLVTEEGARVETKGAWEVKGRAVVFTRPNGTLASMRLSEVDLEASEKLTALAKAPPPEPETEKPKEKKKPVLVLTDADVARAKTLPNIVGADGPAADEPGAAGAQRGSEEEQPPLEVESWNRLDTGGRPDVEIGGILRNNSTDVITGVSLVVRLYGSDNEMVAETSALFQPNSLAPGGSVAFRAVFPGIYGFVSAGFEIQSSGGWRVSRPPEAPADDFP